MESLRKLLPWLGFCRRRGPASGQAEPNLEAPPVIAYPPVEPGLPHSPVRAVLDRHEDLIGRIKLCYGAGAQAFERDLGTIIDRYARFVHLLPATADNYFCAPGGLLRLGLEVSFFALQATDGQIFSGRSTITARRQLEPRWRQATFIAGLCHELHRSLSHLQVTDSTGAQWPSLLVPLDDWLTRRKADQYVINWVPNAKETRSLALFALPRIVPDRTLAELAEGNTVIVPHMLASIGGLSVYRDPNILDQLVLRSAALVIDQDLRASANRLGKPILGSHLARFVVDAMRRLVASSAAWSPNAEKSRVWYGTDGVFVIWPNAAGDILRVLEADQLPGIPKAPATILEILVAAGVAAPRSSTSTLWQIFPPQAGLPIDAVRLTAPAVLFAVVASTPPPLPVELATAPSSRAASDIVRPAPAAAVERLPPQASQPLAPPAAAGGMRNGLAEAVPQDDLFTTAEASAADADQGQADQRSQEAPAPATKLTFRGTATLSPQVAAALADIIDSLNGDAAQASARRCPYGLFVPLQQLERRRLDTGMTVRALADADLLVVPPGRKGKTVAYEFDGQELSGVILSPTCIDGLDASDSRSLHKGKA